MASTGVNVVRWGALVFGVFYGFTHQQAIHAKDKLAASQHEYEQKSKLISEAKAKFAEKNSPSKGDGIITNPEDPKFDLEKYFEKVAKENP
ncbi:related to F1F0-ATP synthase subunit E [Ramularia collo-cygni]|uniref:ATP synthase F(0) complex subunit e, mitochondrial n=1 Tax=Ramularia collo-cygni TaxID=112498 RepID=A0A2D3UT72_9PEZI|nr:related to F1F0-ATP synthase subunit E [Ramularia collo-cygni]CZT17075.1 related to F1F0-ATP synthase subunit E [Ramularia collo-cygni]